MFLPSTDLNQRSSTTEDVKRDNNSFPENTGKPPLMAKVLEP